MAVTHSGKPAITHVRVAEKFRSHTLVLAQLETGRTHQIRVHLSFRGYPLVGDSTYGGQLRLPPEPSVRLKESLTRFNRQALHAQQLQLTHPCSKKRITWTQSIPDDMQTLIHALCEDAGVTYPLTADGLLDNFHTK